MKKLILSIAAFAALGAAGTAIGAPIVAVTEPSGTFTGTYVKHEDDPATTNVNEYEEGTQKGYVGVYSDGVVACNGNPELTRPDDGSPLQGYIWVGPGQAADVSSGEAPGRAAGAGHNNEVDGDSPCPDENPDGVNEL